MPIAHPRRWERLLGRFGLAVIMVVALGTAGTAIPATAAQVAPVSDRLIPTDPVNQKFADRAFLAAIQRDLGLSASAAVDLLTRQAEAVQLADELATALGDGYAGAWIEPADGELVVAVTGSAQARQVRGAGAAAVVVEHNLETLTTITAELDELAGTDPAALDGATGWGVDPATNQVVVTATSDRTGALADLLAGYGDAVRVAETAHRPVLAADYLDGGLGYNTCSVGFNVVKDGVGHFLTAGHCDPAGATATRNGVPIGPVVESWFPEYDDALVRNDNPDYWLQGPWVSTYTAGSPDLVYELADFRDSPVGTVVCKSGRTTQVTCGQITGKNQTVVYEGGVVYGLTRHDACVEPGDSGGATISAAGDGQFFAEGMTSGAQLLSDGTRLRCLSYHGGANVSWFQPVAASLEFYDATLMTAG